jgi:hypothetical protein
MPPDDLAPLIAAVLDSPGGSRPVASLPPPVAHYLDAAAAGGWVVTWDDLESGVAVTLTPWAAEQLGVRLDDAGRWVAGRGEPIWDQHDRPGRQPRERGVYDLHDRAIPDPGRGPLDELIHREGLARCRTDWVGAEAVKLWLGKATQKPKRRKGRAKRRAA